MAGINKIIHDRDWDGGQTASARRGVGVAGGEGEPSIRSVRVGNGRMATRSRSWPVSYWNRSIKVGGTVGAKKITQSIVTVLCCILLRIKTQRVILLNIIN